MFWKKKKEEMSVEDYVTELLEKGEITSNPKILGFHQRLPDIHVIKELENGFIGQSCDGFELPEFSEEEQRYNITYKPNSTSQTKIYYVLYSNNTELTDLLANSDVFGLGPQEKFPGAVAVARLEYAGHNTIKLDLLQYCFKINSPPELTKKRVSDYFTARKILLEKIILDYENHNFEFSDNFCHNERNLKAFNEIKGKPLSYH